MRGATTNAIDMTVVFPISIHAPLAGRDGGILGGVHIYDTISIHAPLAGRDKRPSTIAMRPFAFQSTRPLRGATYIKAGTAEA